MDTHKAGAQAEDGGVRALGVDVSAEKAVAHVARVTGAPVRSQVCHRVGRGDEVRLRREVEMEAVPERVNPVVDP